MAVKEQHIDLSRMTPDAVKAEVRSATLSNPLTIFPLAGGALLLAFWGIFDAGMIIMGAGIAGALFGGSMFPINFYLRFDSFRTKYFAELRAENERIAKAKLEDIEAFLDERNFEQGARQVTKIQDSMASFERVLERKFEPHEFARARYHGVAEQVQINTLINLEQVVTMLEATDSIDPDYIQNRIEELGEATDGDMDKLNDSQKTELKALEDRWELRENSFENIERLLAKNEMALTELEKIATSIATTHIGGNAEEELASAIESLNGLGTEAQETWG